ncbi:MAG: ABC transporter ATP-binding protein [Clostridiales bacterium]|nr:ABC transporter ATP-binding protein [Clostridiales bacterium]
MENKDKDLKPHNDLKSKMSYARLLLQFLKGSKLLFILSVLFSALSSLCEMLNPQIIRAAIDNAIGGKPSTFPDWVNAIVEEAGGFAYLGENLWIMALAVVAVAAVRIIAEFTTSLSNTAASEILVKNMRDSLFSHIERLPYSWHMENHTGDIIQRCTTDVDTIRTFVAEQLTSVFRISIYLVLSLYFMFSMDTKLALVAALPLPFMLFYSVYFRKDMAAGFRVCDETEGKVSAAVQENLTGVRVVRAFGGEAYERKRFEELNEHYTGLWVQQGKRMGKFFSSQDVFSGIQMLLVTVFGAVFAVRGEMPAGEYIAFMLYNAMLSFPIRRLGRMLSAMSKAGVSLERIAYIMDSQEEDLTSGAKTDMSGDIKFENVSFGYEADRDILCCVDIEIKGGSTLGILGGTGSGKSTLMLLLNKMYPLEEGRGKISIGGTDIRDVRSDFLRQNIAMVLQEPYLFSRSIADNIGIARPGISREQIEFAARDACLDSSVEGFAEGYETFVGERGVTLSGGQKQRAAIARALTQEAPIMIFDDSLSAVDNETDAKIRAALAKRFGKATIIIISHRITTLSKADKVVVLDEGRVIEEGHPDELKSAGGIYQQIYEIQLGVEVADA